jgi:hypothetical protein
METRAISIVLRMRHLWAAQPLVGPDLEVTYSEAHNEPEFSSYL